VGGGQTFSALPNQMEVDKLVGLSEADSANEQPRKGSTGCLVEPFFVAVLS